jgi:hypothetical protein
MRRRERVSRRPRRWAASAALLALGCNGWAGGAAAGCGVAEGPRPLPRSLAENSGIAPSLRTPNVYWTHSDDTGPGVIWAVNGGGAILGRVELEGVDVFDAEDIATSSCGTGACLYLADVGDNYNERDTVAVYRVTEPDPADGKVRSERLPILLPDGPRDIESIFLLPGEQLFLVTKGREQPISVYRYPPPLRPDAVVTLEDVQQLSENARVLPRQVTGASAAPDGSVIVLRTYETLLFHMWDGAKLVPMENGVVNLRSLREAQGEGVGVGSDGLVVLTSEGGPARAAGSITVLRCRFGETG